MKIAVIFHFFGPYHIARLNALSRVVPTIGIELSGITNEYQWDKTHKGINFERITIFPNNNTYILRITDIKKKLFNTLENAKPDVVAINGYSSREALLSLKWCLKNGVKSILMSESSKYDAERTKKVEWIKSKIVNLYDAALVGGTRQKEYLTSLGFSAHKIFTGYASVDNNYFEKESIRLRSSIQEIKKKHNLNRDFFLTSARFIPKKNLLNLIKAYKLYTEKTENDLFDLVIIGDGSEKQKMENLITNFNLTENIHLPGFFQYDKIPEFYTAAKVFIIPSLREQWGLVVNEAMASGLPVLISNRCGCVPDLIEEGVNGFSFNPEKPEELAELMINLINDNTLREKMGKESNRIIKKLAPELFASNMKLAAEVALSSSSNNLNLMSELILKIALLR
ncbi:MAG: hypothetical protein B6D44_16415 [Ignavibacteriales bacterium UTCHB2]|nr:MAG: hypothetical protein B6D44_16415 [Ignavibacteriales bacterium UTCHB2]